nr:site-2 protease family protein [Oceanobacillus limi]
MLLYLFLIVAPLCTFIHEVGHLIGARMLKADQISMSIGSGKSLYTFKTKRIRISVQPSLLLSGATSSERLRPYSSLEIAFITLCGPLCNILFCILFMILHTFYMNDYLFLFMFLNGWIAIFNIIPFKVKDKQSDGYIIIKQIFEK